MSNTFKRIAAAIREEWQAYSALAGSVIVNTVGVFIDNESEAVSFLFSVLYVSCMVAYFYFMVSSTKRRRLGHDKERWQSIVERTMLVAGHKIYELKFLTPRRHPMAIMRWLYKLQKKTCLSIFRECYIRDYLRSEDDDPGIPSYTWLVINQKQLFELKIAGLIATSDYDKARAAIQKISPKHAEILTEKVNDIA